jgi:hypothetical protein
MAKKAKKAKAKKTKKSQGEKVIIGSGGASARAAPHRVF